jgi:hypothetical protein
MVEATMSRDIDFMPISRCDVNRRVTGEFRRRDLFSALPLCALGPSSLMTGDIIHLTLTPKAQEVWTLSSDIPRDQPPVAGQNG